LSAKDGGEAFEKLMEFEKIAKEEGVAITEFVDAIISDVEMPRMDGMHLVKRLRDNDTYKTIPIVMFSSIMSENNRAKALQLGANDTITKPEIGRMVGLADKYIFGAPLDD
jgi:two-component system chemotaxis response regulator CheV